MLVYLGWLLKTMQRIAFRTKLHRDVSIAQAWGEYTIKL